MEALTAKDEQRYGKNYSMSLQAHTAIMERAKKYKVSLSTAADQLVLAGEAALAGRKLPKPPPKLPGEE